MSIKLELIIRSRAERWILLEGIFSIIVGA